MTENAPESPAENAKSESTSTPTTAAIQEPRPGVGLIAVGWIGAGLATLAAIIILLVSMGEQGSKWSDNVAGDIVVTKQLTFAVVWALAGVVSALLALAGHIVRATAALVEAKA